MKVDFNKFTNELVKSTHPLMSYSEEENIKNYKKRLKEKFIELFCIDKIKENACQLNIEIEDQVDKTGYTQTRFTLETEKNNIIPCYLLLPKDGKQSHDVAIILQGHSNGMYVSLGEIRAPEDASSTTLGLALQAVEHGFAAVTMELRGMGENKADVSKWENGGKCKYPASTAFLLGRTLLGERVWDISKLIDVLPRFKGVNADKILITGCSGGGTVSYYASCYDERITMSAPDCAFCPYPESIFSFYHCACNYIPHAFEYFDMQDLSCLIAPRKLLILSGKFDAIFPIHGVYRGMKTVKAIYEKAGASDNVKLVETDGPHAWVKQQTWSAIMEMWNK